MFYSSLIFLLLQLLDHSDYSVKLHFSDQPLSCEHDEDSGVAREKAV